MKKQLYFTLFLFLICAQLSASLSIFQSKTSSKHLFFNKNLAETTDSTVLPKKLISLADAEKVLGQSVQLTSDSTAQERGVLKYLWSYTGKKREEKTGKLSVLYCLLKQFDNIAGAKRDYVGIKKSNEKHKGFEIVQGLGDEAYFHSDKVNFYFIIVRKGNRVFNMKLNKITATTSVEQFKLLAQRIAKDL